jgi:hypothetical protein
LIDFLVVWDKSSTRPAVKSGQVDLARELGQLCIVAPTLSLEWRSRSAPGLTIFAWGHDVVPLAAEHRVASSPFGFSIFNGWMLPGLGAAPLPNVHAVKTHLGDGSNGYGEFLFLDVDRNGDGRVVRNLLGSVQLYQYRSRDLVLLSTRPSIIARYLGGRKLNSGFARWVANYSVPMTQDSLFDGITCVPPGSTIQIEAGRPAVAGPSGNILASESLQSRYRQDRQAYWDEVYDNLVHLMRVVEASDLSIDFPLSGGRDSRLMLGLVLAAGYRDRISRVFTNGPDYSPEVLSAKAVAQHLGLPHEAVWAGPPSVQSSSQVTRELPLHLLVTEGEMSPIDLTARTTPRKIFQLSGQEAGLRNIAGKRDVATRAALTQWLMATVGGGDMCGIMTDEAAEQNRADVENYIAAAEAAGTPFEQIPTRHRVQFRGSRWVSRVWGSANAIGFSPHIFRSEVVTLATYNSGARSRSLEEFHFEMLRRIDPVLVELPFAGQSWDPELLAMVDDAPANPEPLSWPEGSTMFSQRLMYGTLQNNFDAFKTFIIDRSGDTLHSLLDMDRLRAFDVEQLKPGHVQPLWQVIQCALMEHVGDVSRLRELAWEDLDLPELALAS